MPSVLVLLVLALTAAGSFSSTAASRPLSQQQQRRQLQDDQVADDDEARACKRLDPDGDYSVWEQLPHEYTDVEPEQWRRKMYVGTNPWEARRDTDSFIRAMLGDPLAYYESSVMVAVRHILLNRTDQLPRQLYLAPETWQWTQWSNYQAFFKEEMPKLLQEVQPVPGLSEAAAMCRARVFMDKRLLPITHGDEERLMAVMWNTTNDNEGRDTMYTTVWQQATISPFPYGPNSITLYPDHKHRALNQPRFLHQTDTWDAFGLCSDAGETQMLGYFPSHKVAAYEVRDYKVRMHPNEQLDNVHPTYKAGRLPRAIEAGLYKAYDAYLGLQHVLVVDGLAANLPNGPLFCVNNDAAGRLMVCEFTRMLACEAPTFPGSHPHHIMLTDQPANLIGVIFATPTTQATVQNDVLDAIAKLRWCAAAVLLRSYVEDANGTVNSLPTGYTAPTEVLEAVNKAVFVDNSMRAQLMLVGEHEHGWSDRTTCKHVLRDSQSRGLDMRALLPGGSFGQTDNNELLASWHAVVQEVVRGDTGTS
eukprot:jgi/Chlat1/1680/Chrsp127S00092